MSRTCRRHLRGLGVSTCGLISLPPKATSATQVETLWLGHWTIENHVHRVRDVKLGEDASTDLPAAWRAADDGQRNALARLLFKEVRVKDDWVVAVEPQPSFAPFFDWDCQARRLSGGSDGGSVSRVHPAARSDPLRLHPQRRLAGPSRRDAY